MSASDLPCSFPSSGDGGYPSRRSLSDEAIYEIAAEIRAAVRRPGMGDILGDDHELPWPDEQRVIAAAAVLDLLEHLPGP